MVSEERYVRKENIYIRPDHVRNSDPVDSPHEDSMLAALRSCADLQTGSEELWHHMGNPSTRYHFSPQRVDILRPFAGHFSGKSILEIGAECGALTRYLGETAKTVMAVEPHFRKAVIASERCRDLRNVSVVCDDIREAHLPAGSFDVIVLSDMRHYGDPPDRENDWQKELLGKAAGLLKEDGIILLTMDNRLGMKYWAGAPDPETGLCYAGIEDRDTHHSPVCGKEELTALLNSTGFYHKEFYFPFPDHRFPSVILREKALYNKDFNIVSLIAPAIDPFGEAGYPASFFITRAARPIVDNQLVAALSNSFLVVAGLREIIPVDDDILAYTYNSTRKQAYDKVNLFIRENDEILVKREKIFPRCLPLSEELIVQHLLDEKYGNGQLYSLTLSDLLSTPGWNMEMLTDWIAPYYQLLLDLSYEADGNKWLEGKWADAVPFNLLITAGKFHWIDLEWEIQEPLPLSYLLFRGLYHCLLRARYVSGPLAGTPSGAFELIGQVLKKFIPDTAGLSVDFIRREEKYFGPVIPGKRFSVTDFSLPVPADPVVADVPAAGIQAVTPAWQLLTAIDLQVFTETETLPFSEENSGKAHFILSKERQIFRLEVPPYSENITRIRIDPSEEEGLLHLFTFSIFNEQKDCLYYWDAISGNCSDEGSPAFIDSFLLGAAGIHGRPVLLLLSKDPMLIFSLPPEFAGADPGKLVVLLEMAALSEDDMNSLSQNLGRLCSMLPAANLLAL